MSRRLASRARNQLRALALFSLALGACGGRSCGSSSRPEPPAASVAASSASSALLTSPPASRPASLTLQGAVAARPAEPIRLRVPHATGAIKADGELDEEDWRVAGRTESFLDQQTKALGRPYSDARLLWDERNLYLALYAADEDIKATGGHDEPLWLKDAFAVRIAFAGRPDVFGLEFAPNKAVSDFLVRPGGAIDRSWESHVAVGIDLDGSLNDEKEDEEWVIEAALPWSSLGVTDPRSAPPLTIKLSRCDTPRDGPRSCSAWGEGLLDLAPGRAAPRRP